MIYHCIQYIWEQIYLKHLHILNRDFNPEENVSEKLRKVNEIKDSRGLRKFIKETLNASTGKIAHDLLGSVEIPLKVSYH